MKHRIALLFCFCLFSFTIYGQDLETRTIQILSIEAAQEAQISAFDLPFEYSGSYPLTPLDFSKKDDNFWEPVDMSMAVAQTNDRPTREYDIKALQAKTFGFSVSGNYAVKGPTTNKNIAYKQMQGFDFLGSCPPVGVCWRCAPRRSSLFYR